MTAAEVRERLDEIRQNVVEVPMGLGRVMDAIAETLEAQDRRIQALEKAAKYHAGRDPGSRVVR